MSTSVANAFAHFDDPETSETEHFIRQFDHFFDCLNVRSTTEHFQKRKESLKPYTSCDDTRLVVRSSVKFVYTCMRTCTVQLHVYPSHHLAFYLSGWKMIF